MRHSKIVSFGSTRRKEINSQDDVSLSQLLDTKTETVVLFGKSWGLHVKNVLNTTFEENLNMIFDSIKYLRSHEREVIFDAEHYFDGYKSDPDYAIKTLKVAEKAGARALVLCDTNGGTLTHDIGRITEKTVAAINSMVGVHCHNDAGVAVANTLSAVKAGASHIQGTINGFGERCGNADLCQVIPSLKYKMNLDILGNDKTSKENLKELTSLSKYVYELTNIPPKPHQPYVGSGAFSHKAGMHVNAILKHSSAYEHINPEVVGNKRKFLVSELAGRSGIIRVAKDLGFDIADRTDVAEKVMVQVKKLESEGYHLENADATLSLIILKELNQNIEPFKIRRWKVSITKEKTMKVIAEVTVEVNGKDYHEFGEGIGPVHSLDIAIRKALVRRFSDLDKVRLVNYKVTVVDSVGGTASPVRVFIEFREDGLRWAATSVSGNITEASKRALIDGYTYWLLTHSPQKLGWNLK
jgi:2-isopropylmalate synthase|tara:strand:+ start:2192 stop:3598 length:1407 start_codon:yes stop_codon:yes gene_type:complete